MDAIIRRKALSGTVVAVTTRQEALKQAVERLNPNAADLIAEIEHGISRERGASLHVAARAGDYTLEVVDRVADLYRSNGWVVEVRGYWMNLY